MEKIVINGMEFENYQDAIDHLQNSKITHEKEMIVKENEKLLNKTLDIAIVTLDDSKCVVCSLSKIANNEKLPLYFIEQMFGERYDCITGKVIENYTVITDKALTDVKTGSVGKAVKKFLAENYSREEAECVWPAANINGQEYEVYLFDLLDGESVTEEKKTEKTPLSNDFLMNLLKDDFSKLFTSRYLMR